MPTIDEAIERAARAMCIEDGDWPDATRNGGARWVYYVPAAKAAISAFLSDAPVFGLMVKEGMATEAKTQGMFLYDKWAMRFKNMAAKLAEEIQ